MRVDTALVTINDQVKLKVLLTPENEKELAFLEEALEKAEDTEVSMHHAILGEAT